MYENKDLRHELAIAKAHIVKLSAQLSANTELDNTPFEHPAFSRGQDFGVAEACRLIEEALDGKPVQGVCCKSLQEIRVQVAQNITRTVEVEKALSRLLRAIDNCPTTQESASGLAVLVMTTELASAINAAKLEHVG